MCDGCKMLIKDKLTRTLDRYNGTNLKRMYKMTDQEMLQMCKFFRVLVFCEMEMFVKDGMSIIVDRWIGRWFVKSLRKMGFCVCM